VAAQQFIGQDVIVGVRLANSKGRLSDWSNFATLRIEEPLATPANFKVADVPQGVSLTWTEPAVSQFRVYRKTAQDKQPSLLATTQEPNYLDSTTEYGKTYEYHIEGVHEKTVSDLAGPLSITPKDVFPPAVPTGLTASAGIGSIELAWERSTEPDFKEYRVLRSEGGAAFVQIAAGLEAPSYSDRSVESGKRYRYRVAAVDQAGNSSEPSNPVEATAP
jgi:fibronectin type 3 domain-containing protein